MIIQIDCQDGSKIDAIVCYDCGGNLYLKYENDYYFLLVSDNTIEFHQSNNMQKLLGNAKEIKLKKLKNSNDEKSFKGKILNTLEKQKNVDSDSEEETEPERIARFFPENKYYYHEEESEDEYEQEENEFKFYTNGDASILKYLDLDLESPANYNTLVMNPFTKTVEMTLEIGGTNAYVVIFYTNGQIDLNIVGSCRKSFRLLYLKNPEYCDDHDENYDQDKGKFISHCLYSSTV